MGELEPDAELSAAVESAFDRFQYAELTIRVRLPGECAPDGQPTVFEITELLTPEALRMRHVYTILPLELRRIMRLLVMSMRFR